MAAEEHARVARALGAGSPRPTLDAGARALTAEDAYNFDCAGFLHVRQLLSASELSDVAAALSTGADTTPLLAGHPVLRGYLSQLFWSEETGDLRSGPQLQLELPPVLLPQLSRGQPLPPLVGGTAEDGSIDTSRSYFHEAGHRFCHGVKVIWALADEGCQLPEGGYVVIPGSHKSTVGTPPAIRDGTADAELLSLGLLQRPDMAAGDVLFVASSLLQGPRPWAGGEGRLILAEFIAGQARSLRDHADTLEDIAAGLQLEQDGVNWLNSLGPRERAVFTGQDPSSLHHHPSMSAPSAAVSAQTQLEYFLWDLCGYIILRSAFPASAVTTASDAVEWAYATGRLDPSDGYGPDISRADGVQTSFCGSAAPPSLEDLFNLPEPYCQPFRNMAVFPPVLERLEWLMGGGYHFATKKPAVRLMVKGNAGQFFHAGLNESHKDFHYSLHHSGRTYNEQVNVSFQLSNSCEHGGGLLLVPGGHKAQHLMPPSLASHRVMPIATVHPTTRPGDIIIFCGMGSVHGVGRWESEHQRRIVILAYTSRSLGGARLWHNNKM